MLGVPGVFGRRLGLAEDVASRVDWLTRMVGGREVAIGVGCLISAGGDSAPSGGRSWLVGQMVADGLDAAVVTLAWRQGKVPGSVAALTAGMVAAGIATEAVGLR